MLPEKPPQNYHKDDPEWAEFAYELSSRWNLHTKHIAAKLAVNIATMRQHPQIMGAIQLGWSDYQIRAMTRLEDLAQDDPLLYEDPAVAHQVRGLRADAIKFIAKMCEKREAMEEVKSEGQENRKLLGMMSPDALQAELKKYLK